MLSVIKFNQKVRPVWIVLYAPILDGRCFFRPRLGRTLYKVLAVGLVYFILGAVEGVVRAFQVEYYNYNTIIYHRYITSLNFCVRNSYACSGSCHNKMVVFTVHLIHAR